VSKGKHASGAGMTWGEWPEPGSISCFLFGCCWKLTAGLGDAACCLVLPCAVTLVGREGAAGLIANCLFLANSPDSAYRSAYFHLSLDLRTYWLELVEEHNGFNSLRLTTAYAKSFAALNKMEANK